MRVTKSFEFGSWLAKTSAGEMAACERKARSSRLRQTAGTRRSSCDGVVRLYAFATQRGAYAKILL